jgi:NTP pyrophosphatase (non-canonical NTP hydrolase)
MTALSRRPSFYELQRAITLIYGLPNDRWFDLSDMLTNVHRFSMRGVKAVRKDDLVSANTNLTIALSWFTSTANRLNLDLHAATWSRFQYRCWYCHSCPCSCNRSEDKQARNRGCPRSIAGYQVMFARIYPPSRRTEAEAAAHMAEELGEFSEAVMMYRTRHTAADLDRVTLEAADFISCLLGVYNSLGLSAQDALIGMFGDNCHECHSAPCRCEFDFVLDYHGDGNRRS